MRRLPVVASPPFSLPDALRKEGLSDADYDEIVRRLGRLDHRQSANGQRSACHLERLRWWPGR